MTDILTACEFLARVAGAVADREDEYGPAARNFAHVAARWSLTLGVTVSPAQVVLCLIDLKLARLSSDPTHFDSIVDVAGYASLLADLDDPRQFDDRIDP